MRLVSTLHPGHLRRRLGSKAMEGFFWGLSRAGRLHPDADPSKHKVAVLRDIPYRGTGNAAHLLDVYHHTETLRPGLGVEHDACATRMSSGPAESAAPLRNNYR